MALQQRPDQSLSGPAAGAWGALAGMAGSLCCIGPSSAILLGLGSSSALVSLQVDQPVALGAAAILLAGGGWLTARRARACGAGRGAIWRQLALMVASGAIAYALLGVAAPWEAARRERAVAAPPAPPAAIRAPLRQATLVVEKMDCPPCVARLQSLLGRKPFITSFSVQPGNEQVSITYDSSQIDAAALRAQIPAQFHAALSADRAIP